VWAALLSIEDTIDRAYAALKRIVEDDPKLLSTFKPATLLLPAPATKAALKRKR
jgi:hypothetical protein